MMLAAADLGMRTAFLLSLNGAVGNADMGRVTGHPERLF